MLLLDYLLISHLILCSFVICSVSSRIRCAVYETHVNVLIHGLFSYCVFFFGRTRRCVYIFFLSFYAPLRSSLSPTIAITFIWVSVFRNLFISFGRLAVFFPIIISSYALPLRQTVQNDYSQQPKHLIWPFKIWIWIICLFICTLSVVGCRLSVYGTNLYLSEFKHLIKYRRCNINLCSVLCTIQVSIPCHFRLLNWIQRPHFRANVFKTSTYIPNPLWRGAEIDYKISSKWYLEYRHWFSARFPIADPI